MASRRHLCGAGTKFYNFLAFEQFSQRLLVKRISCDATSSSRQLTRCCNSPKTPGAWPVFLTRLRGLLKVDATFTSKLTNVRIATGVGLGVCVAHCLSDSENNRKCSLC